MRLLFFSMMLTASSAIAAPLHQYLPSGAVATFELSNLGAALNTMGALKAPTLGLMGQVLRLAGVDLNTQQLLSLVDTEATAALYFDSKKGGVDLLLSSKVNKTNDAVVKKMLADTLAKDKKASKVGSLKEGNYTVHQAKERFYGYGSGYAYLALGSSNTMLRNHLKMLQNSKASSLSGQKSYSQTMNDVSGQLRMFLDAEAFAVQFDRATKADKSLAMFSGFSKTIRTLGSMAWGMNITSKGIEGTAVQIPNTADKALYDLLTYTASDPRIADAIPSGVEAATFGAGDLKGVVEYADRAWATLQSTPQFPPEILMMNLAEELPWLGNEYAILTFSGSGSSIKAANTDPLASSLNNSAMLLEINGKEQVQKSLSQMIESLAGEKPKVSQKGEWQGLATADFTVWQKVKDTYLYIAFDETLLGRLDSGSTLPSDTQFKTFSYPKNVQAVSYTAKPTIQSKSALRSQIEASSKVLMSKNSKAEQKAFSDSAVNWLDEWQRRSFAGLSYTVVQNGKITTRSNQSMNWK